jgi:hypothetical protein
MATQERKFRFILEEAKKSPPLLIAGDFFHQSKPGPYLEQWVINLLKEYEVRPIVVPGQHDLPGHSLQQVNDSGLGVLAAAGVIELMLSEPETLCWSSFDYTVIGIPYGKLPPKGKLFQDDNTRAKVLLWHRMVINEPLWPGQVADKAPAILRKYPQFDLIVTGDNHQSFAVAELEDAKELSSTSPKRKYRWLINPGSMMRMTATQVDHKPCIYKYENGAVEQIFLPIEDDVFDLTELQATKDKDERIQAFVERLNQEWEAELSFEKNLEKFFDANLTKEEVRELVWGCLE